MNNYTQLDVVNGLSLENSFDYAAPNLWYANNVFDQSTLDWIRTLRHDMTTVFHVTRPENRLLLADSDATQYINKLGSSFVPTLNEVTGVNLNFMTAKYWLDLPNFGCQIHSDSEEIIATMQVFVDLVYNDQWPTRVQIRGTEFMHVDPYIEIPLAENCGYLNLNTDLKKHRVIGGMGLRCSVAFQYNLA